MTEVYVESGTDYETNARISDVEALRLTIDVLQSVLKRAKAIEALEFEDAQGDA